MTTGTPRSPQVLRRLRTYPRALLLAVVLAFVLFLVSSTGSDAVSGRVGGDYPAFYAAGRLVVEDPASLYDAAAQRAEQRELLAGEPDGSLIYFSYPPYMALAYAPLAALPYTLSYALHTVLAGALLVVGLWRLRPLVPLLDRWFEQAVIAALLFFPMFRGITGGQTTALVLCLMAVGIRAMADQQDLVAGAAFAALLVKPQYALPLVGVCLLIGRWRVIAAAAAGGAVLYLAGAAIQGWGWFGPWSDQVRWFSENAAESDAANAISWLGVTEAIFGAGSAASGLIGWPMALLTAASMAWFWRRDGGRDPALLLAYSCPAVLLLAPHALYYDAGLLVVPMVVLADRRPEHRRWVAVLWLLGAVHLLSGALGASPLILVVAATLVLVAAELQTSATGPAVRGVEAGAPA